MMQDAIWYFYVDTNIKITQEVPKEPYFAASLFYQHITGSIESKIYGDSTRARVMNKTFKRAARLGIVYLMSQ